jgi:hypothetical protein
MTFALGFLIKLLLRWGVPQKFASIAADGIVLFLIAGALWAVHSHIWHAGYDAANAEWQARQQAVQAKAQADSWKLVGDIHQIDTTLIQTVEKIREVPRDKPRYVAVEVARDLPCLRFPDRLLDATNQYTRDLAAASGHRILTVPAADGTQGRGTGDGGR